MEARISAAETVVKTSRTEDLLRAGGGKSRRVRRAGESRVVAVGDVRTRRSRRSRTCHLARDPSRPRPRMRHRLHDAARDPAFSGRPAAVQRPIALSCQRVAPGRADEGGDMRRQILWLAVISTVAVAALAATGGASATGMTQVDGIQTPVSGFDTIDPTDDVFAMDGYGGGRPAL